MQAGFTGKRVQDKVELYFVEDAKKAIVDYMDFYNLKCKHQSLGYKVPFSV